MADNNNRNDNDPFETFFTGPKFKDEGENPQTGPFAKKNKRIYIICLIIGWALVFGFIAYLYFGA